MTLPFLTKIDVPCIATMSLSHRVTEAVGLLGNSNEMDVIGHEAIRPNLNFMSPAGIGDQGDIFPIIVVAEKSLHTAVPPLRNMVGYARHNDPCYPCHRSDDTDIFRKCQ